MLSLPGNPITGKLNIKRPETATNFQNSGFPMASGTESLKNVILIARRNLSKIFYLEGFSKTLS